LQNCAPLGTFPADDWVDVDSFPLLEQAATATAATASNAPVRHAADQALPLMMCIPFCR
jgi:hypothetical protein